jgi:hypothetical protein
MSRRHSGQEALSFGSGSNPIPDFFLCYLSIKFTFLLPFLLFPFLAPYPCIDMLSQLSKKKEVEKHSEVIKILKGDSDMVLLVALGGALGCGLQHGRRLGSDHPRIGADRRMLALCTQGCGVGALKITSLHQAASSIARIWCKV